MTFNKSFSSEIKQTQNNRIKKAGTQTIKIEKCPNKIHKQFPPK
jgi:hypothetical protein